MDELSSLLHLHRGDDAFFRRLVPFVAELRELASQNASGLTAQDAEVLSRATVESIVDELQAQLRGASRSASATIVPALLGPRASRLLCLALLSSGLAACTQRPSDDGSAGEPGTRSPVATKPAPIAAPPYSEPGTALAPAVVDTPDALVEMFKNKSPAEAAQELERVLDAGRKQSVRPIEPKPRPAYKGVEYS
ncbi:MAG: hypothetical protein QM765_31245 [Myxococcales bacterium]